MIKAFLGYKGFHICPSALILSQLNDFLVMADDVFRERRNVENLRLDLDVAKGNIREARVENMEQAEQHLNLCQDKFIETQSIFKELVMIYNLCFSIII